MLNHGLRTLIGAYRKQCIVHPYRMSIIHYSIGLALSDVFVQKYIERNDTINARRTTSFFTVGLVLGPVTQKWVFILEKLCPNSQTLRTALIRTAVDQLTFNPVLLVMELAAIKILEGKGNKGIHDLIKHDMTDILITNYIFWPPAMVINFLYIPLRHRVLFMVVADFLWTSYLSWRAHSSVSKKT